MEKGVYAQTGKEGTDEKEKQLYRVWPVAADRDDQAEHNGQGAGRAGRDRPQGGVGRHDREEQEPPAGAEGCPEEA